TFLSWLAGKLKLRGGVRRMDGQLWHLGTGRDAGVHSGAFAATLLAVGARIRATVTPCLLQRASSPGCSGCLDRFPEECGRSLPLPRRPRSRKKTLPCT